MYRKITVNGTDYKYVIGNTHTKIVGVGVWPNEEIGSMRDVPEYCECCGEPMSALYSTHVDRSCIAVTPVNIARKIKAFAPTEQNTFDALLGK